MLNIFPKTDGINDQYPANIIKIALQENTFWIKKINCFMKFSGMKSLLFQVWFGTTTL